jgi:hypothetical protein
MANDDNSQRPAHFPPEYGESGGQEALLPWSFVEERLRAAPNYWVATVGPGNRPHVRPLDGVWVEGALIFGGSPETRWVRNLQRNPAMTATIGGYDEAIILEGDVEYVTDEAHPLSLPSREASLVKYPQYAPDGEVPEFLPFWLFRPRRVFAWTLAEFAKSASRWEFPV